VASLLLARPLPHDAAGDRGDPAVSRRASSIVNLRRATSWLRAFLVSLVFAIPGVVRAIVRA